MGTIIQSLDGLIGDIANGSVSGASNGSDYADVIPDHVTNVYFVMNGQSEIYNGGITYDWASNQIRSAGLPATSYPVAIAWSVSGVLPTDVITAKFYDDDGVEVVGLTYSAGINIGTFGSLNQTGATPPTSSVRYPLKIELTRDGVTTVLWENIVRIYV